MITPEQSTAVHAPKARHPDMQAVRQALVAARVFQLQARLAQGGIGLFLLIDPMLGDPVLPEPIPEALSIQALNALRRQAWERETHALQLPAGLGVDAAFAPYLVALQDAKDPWLEDSVSWAVQETLQAWDAGPDQPTPHRVGGWLQTAATGPDLAGVLTGWLRLDAQGAGRARYLRLADRRVLSLAVHVLGQSRVAQAMHPVQRWSWIDPHAALCAMDLQAATGTSLGVASAQPLARFRRDEWALMALGPKVHRSLADGASRRLWLDEETAPAQWPPVTPADWQSALTRAQYQDNDTQEGPRS